MANPSEDEEGDYLMLVNDEEHVAAGLGGRTRPFADSRERARLAGRAELCVELISGAAPATGC